MRRWFGLTSLVLAMALGLSTGTRADDGKKGEVDVFFRKLDANGDGKLNKDEFLQLAVRFKDRDRAAQRLSATYDKIDPANAGITKEQFRRFLELRKK
jgi:Ca2+-binding EF-hand superfamily protein